jgi:hypothetical protein
MILLMAMLALMLVVALPAVAEGSQESDQDTDSGDVDQSFTVSSEGDNSNQCVEITGNVNTGNAQNQIDLLQYNSDADDFEFEDSEADLDASGSSTTECTQEVNQAAAAG